jgi:hypothetical protein
VAVDQPRDDATAIEIDAPRFRSCKCDDLAFLAYSLETSVPDRDRARLRVRAVERGDLAVDQDEIGDLLRQCPRSCAPNIVVA